jgi:adenylate cyclase
VKHLGAILLLFIGVALRARDFNGEFAVVMVDARSEAKLGPFPYDRSLMARAVESCARYKAKAVVFKFFFDQPKSVSGDSAFSEAIAKMPVALQARLEPTEGTSQALPAKFGFSERGLATATSGDRGWIPLPTLLEHASAVGFVDFGSEAIPMVEEYRGVAYKSLVLCCLELAVGAQAHTKPGERIYIGKSYLPVDALNVYRADLARLEPVNIISFAQLLDGEVRREDIEGRVVIVGMDSARMPTLSTRFGTMGIHRFFVQCLAASFRTLMANQSKDPTP